MALFQTPNLWVDEAAEGVAALVLDGPGKVNHLDAMVLREIEQALTTIEAEPRFQLCVLRSKKGASFCHGVEAATWRSLQSPQQWGEFAEHGQRVCARLASSRLPTVAIVSGAALGGGYELALACDWRVAVVSPKTQLGFNELDSGLLPAWGGVGRLVRLLGLERSLQLLLGGRKVSAQDARRLGLVDDLMFDFNDEPPPFVLLAHKRGDADRPARSWRQRLFESTGWGRRLILRGAERVLRRRLPDEMPAPWEILGVVRAEAEHGADSGQAEARAALGRLAESAACQNLLRLQRLKEANKLAATSAARPKKIGVLGVTPLALHLTVQAAGRGCDVAVQETDELLLGMASLQIVKSMQQETDRGILSLDQFTDNVNRVRPTVSWKNFDDRELTLDPASGLTDTDQQRTRDVEKYVPATCVIATAQPWRRLADWQPSLQHPERAAALHFPAPVGHTPLVEILTGPATGAVAIDALRAYAALLGKIAVVAKEDHGGLVSRIWFAGFAETLRLLQEGVPPDRIEQAMQRYGMAHGPLEIIDWIGIEEFILIARRLQSALGVSLADDSVIQHLREQRWLGVKTGLGFYRDVTAKSRSLNPRLVRWLRRSFAANLAPRAKVEQRRHIQERLVTQMSQEAQRCLDEGVIVDSDQVDLAMTLAGWAPHRGGPIQNLHKMDSTKPGEAL